MLLTLVVTMVGEGIVITDGPDDPLRWFHPKCKNELQFEAPFSVPADEVWKIAGVSVTEALSGLTIDEEVGEESSRETSLLSGDVEFISLMQFAKVCGCLYMGSKQDACRELADPQKTEGEWGPIQYATDPVSQRRALAFSIFVFAVWEEGYFWQTRDVRHSEQAERLLGTGDAPLVFWPWRLDRPFTDVSWDPFATLLTVSIERVRDRLRADRQGHTVNENLLHPGRVEQTPTGDVLRIRLY